VLLDVPMRPSMIFAALVALWGCGDLAPTNDGSSSGGARSPRAPSSPDDPEPSNPDVPEETSPPLPPGECGGLRGVVLERGPMILSSLAPASPTATSKIGPVSCGASLDAIVVERSGALLGLAQDGAISRITLGPQPTCASLPSLPASEARYHSLWIAKAEGLDVAYTIRLGTAAEYYADGVYHHQLLRIDLATGAVAPVATLDVVSAPNATTITKDGRIVMTFEWGLAFWDVTGAAPVRVDLALSSQMSRRAVLSTATGLFVIGDIHKGTGVGLPTYTIALPSGATTNGQELSLPGASLTDIVVGSTACAFD
jgi:hypothetical protein